MNFCNHMESLRQEINAQLKILFQDRLPNNLYKPMFYPLNSGGKRIRPLLVILSCESVGGTKSVSMSSAVAVELLHTFTLVHDDIMDHDNMRRGKPTIHVKWDEPTAILAGDGLVTMAYHSLLKTDHPNLKIILQTFTQGLLILCEGQAMDKAFEEENDISLDHYMSMIKKKTAKLIEVACEIGAILGNATRKEQIALVEFSNKLGLAFQIQDDMLDLTTEQDISGKPMGSDLKEKKKTYLTIHFLTHCSPSLKKRFLNIYRKPSLDRKDLLEIRDIFHENNTLKSAQDMVHELIEKSLIDLNPLKNTPAKEHLKDLANHVRNRIS